MTNDKNKTVQRLKQRVMSFQIRVKWSMKMLKIINRKGQRQNRKTQGCQNLMGKKMQK